MIWDSIGFYRVLNNLYKTVQHCTHLYKNYTILCTYIQTHTDHLLPANSKEGCAEEFRTRFHHQLGHLMTFRSKPWVH